MMKLKLISLVAGIILMALQSFVTPAENAITARIEGEKSMTGISSQSQFANAYQAGEAKLKAGLHEEARKDFEKALERATAGLERADALLGIGAAHAAWAQAREYHSWTPPDCHLGKYYFERQRQLEAARTEFEKVIAMPGITPDRNAQAHYHLATVHYGLVQYDRALAELQKGIGMEGVSAEWRVKTRMLMGYYTRYGCKGDPIAVYSKVLDIPGVTPAQMAEARLAMVGILLEKRQSADDHLGVVGNLLEKRNRADAHLELEKIFKIADLPPASLALAHLALGKIFFLEADYPAARDALEKARGTEELPGHEKAEAQLYIGLSDYYEGKNYERAARELRKVTEMPGASYVQIHDATLRLRLKKCCPVMKSLHGFIHRFQPYTGQERPPNRGAALGFRPRRPAADHRQPGHLWRTHAQEALGPWRRARHAPGPHSV